MAMEVRNGDNCSVLVFVKVEGKRLNNEVYRSRFISQTYIVSDTADTLVSRVKDWLYGVRAAQPDRETEQSITSQPLTEAERLRIVHHMITSPREEGGAGITPKTGQWKNIESIFPLHDHTFNKEWIKKWSSQTFLKAEDFDQIRNKFGEKVSYDG